jgi:hypothetical protein
MTLGEFQFGCRSLWCLVFASPELWKSEAAALAFYFAPIIPLCTGAEAAWLPFVSLLRKITAALAKPT